MQSTALGILCGFLQLEKLSYKEVTSLPNITLVWERWESNSGCLTLELRFLMTPWQDSSRITFSPTSDVHTWNLALHCGKCSHCVVHKPWSMCIFTKFLKVPHNSTILLFLMSQIYYYVYLTVKEDGKMASVWRVNSVCFFNFSLVNLADSTML